MEDLALLARGDEKGWVAPVGVRDVAAGIGVTKDTAVRAIAALGAAGLVTLGSVDSPDRRRRSGYRLNLPDGIDLWECPSDPDSRPEASGDDDTAGVCPKIAATERWPTDRDTADRSGGEDPDYGCPRPADRPCSSDRSPKPGRHGWRAGLVVRSAGRIVAGREGTGMTTTAASSFRHHTIYPSLVTHHHDPFSVNHPTPPSPLSLAPCYPVISISSSTRSARRPLPADTSAPGMRRGAWPVEVRV